MSRGFTLIETVIIMVVVGILAAVVFLRGNPFDTIKLDSATRKVAADIRYAQKLAITTQQRSAIALNDTGYSVYEDITTLKLAKSPGDPCSTDASYNFVVDFTQNRCSSYERVRLVFSVAIIAFNSLGMPVNSRGEALSTQTVTVTFNGSRTITIEAGTGRVSY